MNFPSFRTEAIDSAMTKVGSTATYGGAGSALFGYMTLNDLASLVGIVGVIVGLSLQAYFGVQKHRRERRQEQDEAADRVARRKLDEELHAARIARLRAGLPEECE